jgi:hypothetical protein
MSIRKFEAVDSRVFKKTKFFKSKNGSFMTFTAKKEVNNQEFKMTAKKEVPPTIEELNNKIDILTQLILNLTTQKRLKEPALSYYL